MGDSSTLPQINKFQYKGFKGKVLLELILTGRATRGHLFHRMLVDNRRYEEEHNQLLEANSSVIP